MRLRRAARSPLAFWLIVVVLATLTGSVVARLTGRARAEAARYGSLRPVVVARGSIDAGAVIERDDVEVRSVPSAFVPPGALDSAGAAVGRTVVVPVFGGEEVLDAHLAPAGLRGLAALLPPGTRAVAVPTGAATPPLRRGDTVDVLATFEPSGSGPGRVGGGGAGPGREPTVLVAADALVVDVGSDSATVAVDPDQAARVAFAVAHAGVTVTVTPGPGRSRYPPAGGAEGMPGVSADRWPPG